MNFLRSFLLNFFSGPMLCFAAGNTAVGGGGGVESSGGGGGGEGSAPIATWGPPKEGGDKGAEDKGSGDSRSIDDRSAIETGGEEDDFGALDSEDDGDIDGGGEENVSEQTFKQFLDSIKAGITSEDPAVAKKAEKQLKKIYGENQQYREHFESPEAAREVSERLDALGGIEGIETETGEAATLWNMLGAGDPAILDTLQKDHGDGLIKLFGPYVERMGQIAPKVYAHKFAQVFMATMNAAPAGGISVLAAINGLMKFDKVKDSPEFQRIAEEINKINDLAQQEPRTAEGSETLTRKERELKNQEQTLRNERLAAKAAPLLNRAAKVAIEARLNGRKLSPEAMKMVTAWAHEEFEKLNSKDTVGRTNRKNLLAAGDTDKWLKSVKSAANRFMKDAAKAALRKYTGIAGNSSNAEQRRAEGQSRREAGGGGTSAGTIRTKGAPDPKIVDWERMKIEARKNGKDVEDMFTFDRAYFKKGDPRNLYRY